MTPVLSQAPPLTAPRPDAAAPGPGLRDWADGPVAHLPSGLFVANAAWLACATISCNLVRAAGWLASAYHGRPAALPSAVTRSTPPHEPPATAAAT